MEQEGGDIATYPHGRGTTAPKEDKATRPKGGIKQQHPKRLASGAVSGVAYGVGLDDIPNAL